MLNYSKFNLTLEKTDIILSKQYFIQIDIILYRSIHEYHKQ